MKGDCWLLIMKCLLVYICILKDKSFRFGRGVRFIGGIWYGGL